MTKIEKRVINLLQRSDQTLIFFDAIITPISKLNLTLDKRIQVMKSLKEKGIVDYYGGFLSHDSERVYVDHCVLDDKWFQENCSFGKKYKQLELFSKLNDTAK